MSDVDPSSCEIVGCKLVATDVHFTTCGMPLFVCHGHLGVLKNEPQDPRHPGLVRVGGCESSEESERCPQG